MRGGLMVCGTTSDAGKTHLVAGLCRVLARRGVKVAPFKAQNMALNSWVTASGHEIGRAQGVQAIAALVEPEVAMNPVLLKPTSERECQVVVMGEPAEHLSAVEYHARKPELLGVVLDALADLRARFDVVIAEGAGSPAEINLLDHDIVNLRVAHEAGLPAVIVGDIDRGGVFAALYGTVSLLPDHYRSLVRGFVINKLRGDPSLLSDGLADLEARCGVPTLGVLPYVHDVALDAEDSLSLDGRRPEASRPALADGIDIAVVRFPRISNFTDFDALAIEPGVGVRLVTDARALGHPDLVVLPGSKATVADLAWLRESGLDRAIEQRRRDGTLVLGVCAGYQMLGRMITDRVESCAGEVAGLGWLDVVTTFETGKVVRRRHGSAMGCPVSGYEIHHGVTTRGRDAAGWVHLDDLYGGASEGDADGAADGASGDYADAEGAGKGASEADAGGAEGAVDLDDASVLGTNLHGIFEEDAFRAAFLVELGRRRGKTFVPAGVSFAAAREAQIDRIADLVEAHVDLRALDAIIEQGALVL